MVEYGTGHDRIAYNSYEAAYPEPCIKPVLRFKTSIAYSTLVSSSFGRRLMLG